ncbi:MAG TPA: mechanosensitive ion channel family protein, partial [Steroidobacteraceae bacterium]|nr:mechanosensitive ion channel family protein [Steroidobacteraceae bacterium]
MNDMNGLTQRLAAALVIVVAGAALASGTGHAAAEAPTPAIDAQTPIEEMKLLLVPLTVEELANEAAAWQRVVQERTRRVVDQRIALLRAQGEEAAALRSGLTPLLQERRVAFDGLLEVLKAWEAKGGDAAEIATYRRYVSSVRSDEIRSTDTSTVWATFESWLTSRDGGIRIGLMALGFIFALALLYLIAKLLARVASRGLGRLDGLSTLLREFLGKAAFWAAMVLGTLTLLSWFGVRLTPVLTLLGGLSFVLAFATQNTLSNFAAGLMIMVYKPFDVG